MWPLAAPGALTVMAVMFAPGRKAACVKLTNTTSARHGEK